MKWISGFLLTGDKCHSVEKVTLSVISSNVFLINFYVVFMSSTLPAQNHRSKHGQILNHCDLTFRHVLTILYHYNLPVHMLDISWTRKHTHTNSENNMKFNCVIHQSKVNITHLKTNTTVGLHSHFYMIFISKQQT